MEQTLNARFTTTIAGTPLAKVSGLPGYESEFTPDQLRHLAGILQRIAEESERFAGQPGREAEYRFGVTFGQAVDQG